MLKAEASFEVQTPERMKETSSKPTIGAIIFDGYELLDTYGPLELFLMDNRLFDSVVLAEQSGKITSAQGPVAFANKAMEECEQVDVLLIPGGRGTRKEIQNTKFLDELKRLASSARYVCTVCTGSALLAKTGLIDGRKATSNKAAWKWVVSQGACVNWIPEARWVEDGKYFTSSGVSAGMDMALGHIEVMFGKEKSLELAMYAEYEWHENKDWDPFAKIHGLTTEQPQQGSESAP